RRQAVRQALTDWEHPIYAIFLLFAGALLTLPTPWVLIAVPLLVAARAAAKWVAVRYGSVALHLPGLAPNGGLGTVAQGGAAIAMGLNFFITYGGEATGPSGALLTTIVLGVAGVPADAARAGGPRRGGCAGTRRDDPCRGRGVGRHVARAATADRQRRGCGGGPARRAGRRIRGGPGRSGGDGARRGGHHAQR